MLKNPLNRKDFGLESQEDWTKTFSVSTEAQFWFYWGAIPQARMRRLNGVTLEIREEQLSDNRP